MKRAAHLKRAAAVWVLCFSVLLTLCSCGTLPQTETTHQTTTKQETATVSWNTQETTEAVTTDTPISETPEPSSEEEQIADGSFEETMLNVGQGLSILLQADGQNMIYDGGGRDSSSYVVAYLKQHDITHLSYMFVSHYDEDHIAGLVGVLHTTSVDTIVCPDYEADAKIYASFSSAAEASSAQIVHPSVGDTFSLGNAEITVLGPENYTAEAENNRSVASKITYGSFSTIITGDAEYDEESGILKSGLDINADLYVAGHHGSSNSSSTAFVAAMSPSDVFISCGAGNSYGHPTEKALSVFQKNGCSIYRSDIQGEVTCYADGSSYWFSQEPCDDWTPGIKADQMNQTVESASVTENTSVQEDAGGVQYIGNSHTKKFHLPSCPSVSDMKDSNKVEFHSRDEAISEGYVPCKQCNP